MLSKKIDVDRHVEYTIKRISSESERNLRSYAFAKLYYNVSEYEQARRYISNYLIVKPKSAEGHLLLGNIQEKLGKREAALEAYRNSLDIDPKQNGLVLKVCELLASDDITLDATRARYWCEQASLLDPQHPAVFDLRERLAAADSTGSDDILKLFISELENRPTDVGLRVRLLQHMLDYNKLALAYEHVSEIEEKNLPIFADHLVWYETVAKILVRYKNENIKNTSLTWQFWMLIVSVFDKLVSLSLDENVSSSKNLSDCVRAIFNLDQTLSAAADNINSQCMEKQLTQEFLIHYRAQLCFHIATLIFKQAKKDQIKYKEAINFAIPLCLISYHSQPIELQCVWLEHASDQTRKLAHRWNREAAYRCSQTGHTLLSLVRERRSAFADRVAQLTAGAWRDRIYKNIFITRDQQLKIKTSYFVNCLQLEEVANRLPDNVDLIRYDETAQLVHPNSLHHMIWIGLNIQPVKFNCTVFEGLQYSVKNLSNCAAETLNLLDIQAFLYCSIFCAQANIEESKHLIYYNQEKPTVLPAAITEPYGTLNQTKWFSCVHKMYSNESGSDLSDIRVTLIKGIEIVRCAGTHGLDVKLLVLLANTFAQKAKTLTKPSEIEYTEARAELYWKAAIPMLEKIRNNQAISYPTKRWFEYRGKDISPSELNMYIEDGKLFSAVQLMKKKEHEKALQMLESLKNPYASFYQAQTYKLLADEQMSHHKENVTSEMRSQYIILLSKARDCYYLTLDRLREPSVDRKHPLNAELGTEIEKIERLLSRIDPDICANRNECDGMSDENVSSVGSVGEHVNVNSSNYMMLSASNSYHLGNMSTPRHDHHATYRIGGLGGIGDASLLNSSQRREARPSPERLDAQLRQMAAAKDATYQHILEQHRIIMDTHRSLVDELRGFKEAVHGLTSSVDEIRIVKKSVEELKTVSDDIQNMKEQIYEIKKDLTELKKDTNKLKSTQINEEDLYALEEEYGVDYNINQAAGTSGFNSAAALYPNFPQRLQGAAAAAAAAATANMYSGPGLYGMYPMYPPYGSLGLSQAGALPFPDGVGAHIPDFRTMGSIGQGLSHAGLGNQPQATNMNMFGKYDNNTLPPQQSLTNVATTPLLPSLPTAPIQVTVPSFQPTATTITNVPVNKAPPVNVVITASDPLPTTVSTTSSAQILSVTIPPQHLKGNQPKPHNYQIPLPTTSQPSFANVQTAINQTPLPVTTQNLLSNVAPPVYSSLTVKSPSQQASNNASNLGLQIEKSLSQSFPSTPNTTFTDNAVTNASITQKTDLNKSNVSEGSYLEEHDPCPDFKPIIPLPDEVPLTTGEEQETVLFCAHAKLYRFVEKEWRERGIGNIKLLYNDQTGKVRVLMRRDQVHKICANHYLTEDLQLTPMPNNERAYIWAANDFADENVVLEKLCVRFKTVEEAKKFATEFENGKKLINKTATSMKSDLKDVKKTLFPTTTKPATNTITATSTSTPTNTTTKENSLGGFVFTSTPTFMPKTDLTPEVSIDTKQKTDTATPKSSPFVGFSFGLQQTKTPQQLSTPTTAASPFLSESMKTTAANTSLQQSNKNDEDENDFVPTTEFKPVIPLPDLVEVKTGEENSEVLYEVKAKLHRFDSTLKEWKERGVGIMKILKDKTIRLVMRREQVHKVCCNHQVLKSMVFTNTPRDNRVLNWCAQDFSENVLKPEMFAIRFRTPELCEEFLQMIHKAQDMLDSSNNVMSGATMAAVKASADSKSQQAAVGGWGDAFKMKEGNWECGDCYVNNTAKNSSCLACGSPRPRASNKSDNAQSPQKFKPSPAPTVQPIKETKHKVGTWECKTCFIHNDGKNKNCEACDTPKSESKKDDLNTSTGNIAPATSTGAGTPAVSGWGDQFKPKAGAWNCKACYLSNDASTLYCIACESPKDDTVPKKENKGLDLGSTGGQKFSFGMPLATATATATKPAQEQSTIFGLKAQPTAGFTFGMPQNPLTVTSSTGFSFGIQQPATTTSDTTTAPLNLTSKPSFTFSLTPNTTNETTSTTTTTTTLPKNDEFVFGSPNKHEFEFKPRSPRKVSGGEGGDESDDGGLEEECDNIYFKPVIPLPDKVEVKTGEENETMLYCHRAKLYRFVDGEWKERGVGDLKILKNPESGKLRVLMRRDQIHKICLNHALTNEIEYKSKDDKTWLFSAPDYSESEIVFNQFCLRFKNNEIAQQFLDAVNKARTETTTSSTTTTTTNSEQETTVTATATTTSVSAIDKTKSKTTSESQDDSDIEIVYETQVSPELQEKALALKLPKNFYAYLTKEPCKGCIGCNDENFVFNTTSKALASTSTATPTTATATTKSTVDFTFDPKTSTPTTILNDSAKKIVDTPKSTTSSSNLFGSGTSTVFGTPQSTTNIFATNNTTTTTTKSNTFNFNTTTNATTTTTKPFSSPFNFTPSTVQPPANLFSTPTTAASPNLFGGHSSTPTLTKLLTQTSASTPTVNVSTTEHKSPLAPSKLANVLTTSQQQQQQQQQTTNIFSGTNIFGGNKTQNTENQTPNKTTSTPIFGGGSIFGGGATTATATATPVFGASAQNTTNIFGGGGNSGSIFGQQTPASNMSIFGNLAANTPTFGSLAAASNKTTTQPTEKKEETKAFSFAPVFGTQTKPAEAPLLKCDSSLSFAALASSNQGFTQQPTTETTAEIKPFSFAGAGSQVFGSSTPKSANSSIKSSVKSSANTSTATGTTEDDDGEDAAGDTTTGDATEEYDPHYEPIVPLPDAIDVKTGEEDEEVVYNERAKLYRYSTDTKEWKERGVGQLKILHHPTNCTYRLLLRREQVHKLVLNQLITTDMDLQPMQMSDRAWLWAGFNHSEDGSQLEKLAVRFKNPELAIKFRDAVQQAQKYVAERPQTSRTEDVEHGDDEEEADEDDVEEEEDAYEEYGSDESDENKYECGEVRM